MCGYREKDRLLHGEEPALVPALQAGEDRKDHWEGMVRKGKKDHGSTGMTGAIGVIGAPIVSVITVPSPL